MSSPWHRHQCVVPLSPALMACVGQHGAPWAQGHTARHLQGVWQRGREPHRTQYLSLQWFALFCTITEDSCNRFSLATSTYLLRLPQVKKDIIQSGKLKWPFTVSGSCSSIFLLLRRTSGLLFLPVGSVIRNHFAISSEPHNLFFPFFSCQMVTNESNQLITFPEDILPTQGLLCPRWQNTRVFKITRYCWRYVT